MLIVWIVRCVFNSGCTFKCNFDNAKSCFFRALNKLYSTVGQLSSEEVVLSPMHAKCLPILIRD